MCVCVHAVHRPRRRPGPPGGRQSTLQSPSQTWRAPKQPAKAQPCPNCTAKATTSAAAAPAGPQAQMLRSVRAGTARLGLALRVPPRTGEGVASQQPAETRPAKAAAAATEAAAAPASPGPVHRRRLRRSRLGCAIPPRRRPAAGAGAAGSAQCRRRRPLPRARRPCVLLLLLPPLPGRGVRGRAGRVLGPVDRPAGRELDLRGQHVRRRRHLLLVPL